MQRDHADTSTPVAAGDSVLCDSHQQTEVLSLWSSYREKHPGPPPRLLEALGEHRSAFEAYLRAPDRDEHGRGLALLDVAVERSLQAAISLETPGFRDQIRGLLASIRSEKDEERREELLRQAHGLAKRGAAEADAWEALSRSVERRERALRESRRVALSQGQVVTAAAAIEAVSKAVQALVPFVSPTKVPDARAALERALDDRTQALEAGLRWFLDSMLLEEGAA